MHALFSHICDYIHHLSFMPVSFIFQEPKENKGPEFYIDQLRCIPAVSNALMSVPILLLLVYSQTSKCKHVDDF